MRLFDFARPALFTLSPEKAHALSISGLKSGLVPRSMEKPDPRLAVPLGGLVFPNPVGLAAGYDKNAEVPDEILSLGFGFTEVGTITPQPQDGNPKPRVFRLTTDEALINRLGFNNEGHHAALTRLKARQHKKGIVGVNIGANKDSDDFVADYEKGIETFFGVASYFTANISSPNTPGLRNLQAGDALRVLLERIFATVEACAEKHGKAVPVFLKVAPDLEAGEIDEIAEIVSASPLAALIVSNTTLDRHMLRDQPKAGEAGGLSGKPLFEKSTRALAEFYKRLKGQTPLIGVGGISSADDALHKIKAGASLVQLYTGMVYAGPCLPANITKGLSSALDHNGAETIDELVGTEYEKWA